MANVAASDLKPCAHKGSNPRIVASATATNIVFAHMWTVACVCCSLI